MELIIKCLDRWEWCNLLALLLHFSIMEKFPLQVVAISLACRLNAPTMQK